MEAAALVLATAVPTEAVVLVAGGATVSMIAPSLCSVEEVPPAAWARAARGRSAPRRSTGTLAPEDTLELKELASDA